MTAAAGGRRYAMAAIYVINIAFAAMSLGGTLYIATGLARRLTALGLSGSRPRRLA